VHHRLKAASGEMVVQEAPIGQVTCHKLGLGVHRRLVPLAQVVQHSDLVALADQLFDDYAADIARPAGNEDLHSSPFLPAFWRSPECRSLYPALRRRQNRRHPLVGFTRGCHGSSERVSRVGARSSRAELPDDRRGSRPRQTWPDHHVQASGACTGSLFMIE